MTGNTTYIMTSGNSVLNRRNRCMKCFELPGVLSHQLSQINNRLPDLSQINNRLPDPGSVNPFGALDFNYRYLVTEKKLTWHQHKHNGFSKKTINIL